MTRVALATRIFTPEAAAATFRLAAVVRALVGRGADVDVLTAAPPPGRAPEDDRHVPGARVRRWPVLRDEAGYVRGYLQYLSFDVPLALRLLTVRRPDVVLVEPPPTTGAVVRVVTGLRSLVSRRRLPYVYYAADIWSDASASTGAPAPVVAGVRAVERYALRGARDVIAVSEGVAERVRALGGRAVRVIPNGIDTDTFAPDGDRPDAAPDTPFLVYAGTASEWQGAEVFARAMRHVVAEEPGARLVFLGQGSSWPELRRIAEDLPAGTIELRPLVPPEEAAAWQRAAAAALVSVKPGLGYDFAYPTKVIAALACGTPVVYAGPGPAAEDLVTHRLGEATAYDETEVAAAILRVLRAGGDEEARARRVAWVLAHRSLAATGEGAADVVLAPAP
ncbi:glycosyltransferase family 4 protein [Ornithinicoccus hortensis]|uniref:D-inositol 3-phosphate glycosyltransferase n=1 Tax=Ornithinicoccus hortensis TaxID=82346 RepID=A0A542YU01_9MICO|nr:glycosyltransferase family 4 protein [Ornithinicoccus hortensis]TQL51434.1 glycosyltransferase involved in cell wall biosynthesis [Ornithinicoccus hortensis]